MSIFLTETHQIAKDHRFWKECDQLCFISKNLYNSCLYQVRQYYSLNNSYSTWDENGEITGVVYTNTHLYHQMKDTPQFRTENNEEVNNTKTNTKCMKQVFIQINQVYSNYFAAKKAYNISKANFSGLPKPPKYKHKTTGRNAFCFPADALSFKRHGFIKLSMTDIEIKSDKPKHQVKQINITPTATHYLICVVYDPSIIAPPDKTKKAKRSEGKAKTSKNKKHHQPTATTKYLGIDFGINNLATLSSDDIGVKPIIINGRPVKSINQFYNKTKAKLQSELPKDQFMSSKITKLIRKRGNKIKNYMHQCSNFVVNYAVANHVTDIIIGHNKNWKQNINLGGKTNQSFTGIPFYSLTGMIKYKAALLGINVVLQEESYTSKCSFLDMEDMKEHDVYAGKRTKRGLFTSGNKTNINADLNGSLNIIRKVAGNEKFSKSVEGYAVSPLRATPSF